MVYKDGSRSFAYDIVSIISGFLYHDAAGGNDRMKVKGKWQNFYSPQQLQTRLNEQPKGYFEDLKDNLIYDAKEIKNSVGEGIENVKNKIENTADKIKNEAGDIINDIIK